jgi:general secretion pathway protein C
MPDVTEQRWWSNLPGNAPRVVSIVLGVLVATELGHTALVLPELIGVGPLEAKSDDMAGLRDQIRPRRVDVKKIVEAHLFGDAAESVPTDPAEAPPTSANLLLTGTLAAADPKRGTAIINDAGRSAMFFVGADVGGASVYAVYVDRVILNRRGKFESLFMPRSTPPPTGGTAQYAVNSGFGKAPQPAQQRTDDRKPGLGDIVRVGAAVGSETGQIRGFHIYPGKDRSAFADAGLRGGDIVVAINGVSLLEQNRRDGGEAFNAIANADRATMTIERFGRTTDVTIDAAQAGASAVAPATNGVEAETSVQ